MPYAKTVVKPDNPSEEKYFYVCQTRGCGAIINPEFPVGLKTPSPKRCRDCQSAEVRKVVEAEYDARHSS